MAKPARVLAVVEDEPDMRLLIRITLEHEASFEVIGEAATAEDAIRLARDLQPDIVILDHVLDGDVMGLEAAPKIKEVCPTTKILMFSAHPIEKKAMVEEAVDDFVSKADLDDLVPAVRRLLGI